MESHEIENFDQTDIPAEQCTYDVSYDWTRTYNFLRYDSEFSIAE